MKKGQRLLYQFPFAGVSIVKFIPPTSADQTIEDDYRNAKGQSYRPHPGNVVFVDGGTQEYGDPGDVFRYQKLFVLKEIEVSTIKEAMEIHPEMFL